MNYQQLWSTMNTVDLNVLMMLVRLYFVFFNGALGINLPLKYSWFNWDGK